MHSFSNMHHYTLTILVNGFKVSLSLFLYSLWLVLCMKISLCSIFAYANHNISQIHSVELFHLPLLGQTECVFFFTQDIVKNYYIEVILNSSSQSTVWKLTNPDKSILLKFVSVSCDDAGVYCFCFLCLISFLQHKCDKQ